MARKRSGKERLQSQRARRKLRGTYDLERAGVDPADSIAIAAEEREHPEPKDGPLFQGPGGYILQDLKRVLNLMSLGYMTESEQRAIFRALLARMIPQPTEDNPDPKPVSTDMMLKIFNAVSLHQARAMSALTALYGKRQPVTEQEGGSKYHEHKHLHIYGGAGMPEASQGDPVLDFLQEMLRLEQAGSEFLEDDAHGDNETFSSAPEPKPAASSRRKRRARPKNREKHSQQSD